MSRCAAADAPVTLSMAQRGDAIVLVGFMGTGKSSVGREIARRTGFPRFDTDQRVAAQFGCTVAEIFARHGEEAFRKAESAALMSVPKGDAVVVTGGGILIRPENARAVRRLGVVAHLTCGRGVLLRRLARRQERPLLQGPDRVARIDALLEIRAPLYRAAADFEVDTTELTHAEVADAVLGGVEKVRRHAA